MIFHNFDHKSDNDLSNIKIIIMKKLLFFLIICLQCIHIDAQNPQGFNYQAVARDATGGILTNRLMPVKITIQTDSLGGTILMQELHPYINTGSLGIINLVVGKGSKITGDFNSIDWSTTPLFIKTEIYDGTWKTMGSSRLWSVPYSMISDEARSITAGSKLAIVSDNDASTDALFEVKRKDGQSVFSVYNDSVNVYVPDNAKKVKGGFAVGGFDASKGFSQRYMVVTPDSIRFYINDNSSKEDASKGGFAVGGFNVKKNARDKYLSLFGASKVDTITNASQILWYPRKEAFLAGRVDIRYSDSVGINSFSMGFKNRAIGDYSHAMGYLSVARGPFSTAIGNQAVSDSNSFALGNFSQALGNDSYAIGSAASATAKTSMALGVGSVSRGQGSLSIGFKSIASQPFAVAIGDSAMALAYTAHAFGLKAQASAVGSIALGMYAQAQADYATSLGYCSVANNQFSTAIGYHAFASGPDSYAIGSYSEANGAKSFAIGSYGLNDNGTVNTDRATWTPGYCSLAFGMGAQATKIGSMSLGVNTTASGDQSLAIGFGTSATNQYATAMGYEASANGLKSIAIGAHYKVTFDQPVWVWSATLGKWINSPVTVSLDKQTTANDDYSIAIGNGNQSSGGGLTFGNNNIANAFGSTAIGFSNTASGDFSFASGFGNNTTGLKSFAMGESLVAQAANSFVIGAYNKIEGTSDGWLDKDPIFVIGNGSMAARSNAFEVTKDGNIILSPNLVTAAAGMTLIYDPVDNMMKKIVSSRKYKTAIEDIGNVGWLYDLKPVSFKYKTDKEGRTQYGLIAEDMETVNKDLVIYLDGKPESINYNGLFAPMIKAIQDQKLLIEDINSKNTLLSDENESLKARIEKLENEVAGLMNRQN